MLVSLGGRLVVVKDNSEAFYVLSELSISIRPTRKMVSSGPKLCTW